MGWDGMGCAWKEVIVFVPLLFLPRPWRVSRPMLRVEPRRAKKTTQTFAGDRKVEFPSC